uniref:Uncharacterized protein n=1 Tax=Rhizophora mucronata TaxID=61149 RepID=A0A2P2NHG3_RHIMU
MTCLYLVHRMLTCISKYT